MRDESFFVNRIRGVACMGLCVFRNVGVHCWGNSPWLPLCNDIAKIYATWLPATTPRCEKCRFTWQNRGSHGELPLHRTTETQKTNSAKKQSKKKFYITPMATLNRKHLFPKTSNEGCHSQACATGVSTFGNLLYLPLEVLWQT